MITMSTPIFVEIIITVNRCRVSFNWIMESLKFNDQFHSREIWAHQSILKMVEFSKSIPQISYYNAIG